MSRSSPGGSWMHLKCFCWTFQMCSTGPLAAESQSIRQGRPWGGRCCLFDSHSRAKSTACHSNTCREARNETGCIWWVLVVHPRASTHMKCWISGLIIRSGHRWIQPAAWSPLPRCSSYGPHMGPHQPAGVCSLDLLPPCPGQLPPD